MYTCNLIRVRCTPCTRRILVLSILYNMLYRAYRFSTSLRRIRRSPLARYFHRATADFLNYNSKGYLVTEKVSVIVGNPGKTYLLVYSEVGSVFRAAAKEFHISADVGETCKLASFHESQHFVDFVSNYH